MQIINVQYCYDYLAGQIPMELLLYSHFLPILVSITFAVFLFFKVRSTSAYLLITICFLFSFWSLFELVTWFGFLGADLIMFAWSTLDFIAVLIFFVSLYFIHVFITGKDLSTFNKIISIIVLAPTALITFLGENIISYDTNICEAVENGLLTKYTYFAEFFFIIMIVYFVVKAMRNERERNRKRLILLSGSGVVLFLLFIFTSSLIVSLLVETNSAEYAYNYGIYGLFGMPLLLIFLGYLIVKFKAFDIKLLATQALIWTLIILVGSQFFFIRNPINYVLNGITFVGTIISGVLIVRSVKRVDSQREELALANQEQETLVHFITHQIKGYFTKSRNIFDTLTDMENVPESAQRLVVEGLRSDKEGVELVENILNAANLKTGKMQFKDEKGSLDQMVKKLVDDMTPLATAKNLKLNFYCSTPVQYNADTFRLKDLFKNLISNAINYTFEGGITIYLNKKSDYAEFIIKDTGVGLTEDDKRRLFTSGGRGAESVKYNVSSTGYGLYIAKKVVDYYHGRIWAESEGRNKGTTFVVTLPLEK